MSAGYTDCQETIYLAERVAIMATIWLNQPFLSQVRKEFNYIIQLYKKVILKQESEERFQKACIRFIYLFYCYHLIYNESMSGGFYTVDEYFTFQDLAIYNWRITRENKGCIYLECWNKHHSFFLKDATEAPGIFFFKYIIGLYRYLKKHSKWD